MGLQSYLLVCVERSRPCRCEAVGQKSGEAQQQANDIQNHQNDDLFKINAKLSN